MFGLFGDDSGEEDETPTEGGAGESHGRLGIEEWAEKNHGLDTDDVPFEPLMDHSRCVMILLARIQHLEDELAELRGEVRTQDTNAAAPSESGIQYLINDPESYVEFLDDDSSVASVEHHPDTGITRVGLVSNVSSESVSRICELVADADCTARMIGGHDGAVVIYDWSQNE